ncbi:hypothetical protein BZL29_8177 [Mycobacterium kansasii]|uniref:Uncharacterized protein n=1 Tax=Mycobacterium kansasii TaxID=1768 RepID=A0A1V3WBP1_MYCKA|nr:hypothetical protein BZL29_8177 [Mycobacterium kansasii]
MVQRPSWAPARCAIAVGAIGFDINNLPLLRAELITTFSCLGRA